MKRIFILLTLISLTLISLSGIALAQQSQREANLRSLVAVEDEFAQAALDQGINPAFVNFFADDSILFNPFPIDGKKFYQTAEKDSGILKWKAIYSDVSAAGDLGYNTGPYEYSPAPGKPVISSGYFVSVWRKDNNGKWLVAVDTGTRNHPPQAAPTPGFAPLNKLPKKLDSAFELKQVTTVDREFAEILSTNQISDSISKFISENVRMNRMGIYPVTSRTALLADLQAKRGNFASQTTSVQIAQSGDLAFSYGTYKINNSQKAQKSIDEKGSFLRIWRHENGNWQLVFDVLRAAETPKAS